MSPRRSETHFIVLPGGGYAAYAENEAEPIVEWLDEVGIKASVLRYPLNARHPIPLEAVRSEVRRLRAMGVARVGAIGFSAGGHLAGHAALSDPSRRDTRLDLAVLGYAITSMEMETYRSARLILVGEDAPPELRRDTSLDALVTRAAPPFFIWHTAEDPYVPVEHSYRLAAALAAQGVPHAFHVFSKGPHSLGLARGAGEPSAWTELAAAWLTARLDRLEQGEGSRLPSAGTDSWTGRSRAAPCCPPVSGSR
jgi:acetyl esterase/lipase